MRKLNTAAERNEFLLEQIEKLTGVKLELHKSSYGYTLTASKPEPNEFLDRGLNYLLPSGVMNEAVAYAYIAGLNNGVILGQELIQVYETNAKVAEEQL